MSRMHAKHAMKSLERLAMLAFNEGIVKHQEAANMSAQHEPLEYVGANGRVLAWAVSSLDGLDLQVRKGDVVRSRAGTVWLTFEGHCEDIIIEAGESHRVEFDARAMISGFGPAGVQIESGQELPASWASGWWRARRSIGIDLAPCAGER